MDGTNCAPLDTLGRGAMAVFSWAPGRNGILRKYRRGGVIRFIFRDRFILANRPLREFLLHREILSRGVPAPRVLGVSWTRTGIFYSGALATEKVEGMDLNSWLLSNPDLPVNRADVLKSCGAVIRKMHDAGVIHGDLQVKNILVTGNAPLLLDFDRARTDPLFLTLRRQCNLLRLKRSFVKRGHGEECLEMLLAGYGTVWFHAGLKFVYRVKGFISDKLGNWS